MPELTKEDIENAHQMLSFPLGSDDVDWDDVGLDDLTANLSQRQVRQMVETLEVWSNDSTIEFGTIIGDDPWKMSETDPWSMDFSNPWSGDIEPDSLQGVGGPDPTSNDIENWASFESNNFADFDKHFTDFEPVSSSADDGSSSNKPSAGIISHDGSGDNTIVAAGGANVTGVDDKTLTTLKTNNPKRMVTKNLIPNADGRLVLETTIFPCAESDNNANIHNKKTGDDSNKDETELDNHRLGIFVLSIFFRYLCGLFVFNLIL